MGLRYLCGINLGFELFEVKRPRCQSHLVRYFLENLFAKNLCSDGCLNTEFDGGFSPRPLTSVTRMTMSLPILMACPFFLVRTSMINPSF